MSRGSRARRRAMSRDRQILQTHQGDWSAPPVSDEARAAEAQVREPLRIGARVAWPDDPGDAGTIVLDGQRLAVVWDRDGEVDTLGPCGRLDHGPRVERVR